MCVSLFQNNIVSINDAFDISGTAVNGHCQGQTDPQLGNYEKIENEYSMPDCNGKQNKYDYVQVKDKRGKSINAHSTITGNSSNYELAQPIPQNNNENYFEIEPQAQDGNCFVLEKDIHAQRTNDEIDNVYNTLHQDTMKKDNAQDEYHHLREIRRSGMETLGNANDGDYNTLGSVSDDNKVLASGDYDHCRPRKFPNGKHDDDDYDHFD